MFIKGSRYRSLPESSPVDAAGERLRGKDIRAIPLPLAWPFRHTVRAGDRLDLLSFKYYTEPTKWWQIADANPQEPFPLDLLDRSPVVEERFVLRNSNFETRFRDLVIALATAFGTVDTPVVHSFGDPTPVDPNFVETTVVVTYPSAAATHQKIVNTIESAGIGFHFLNAFAWTIPPDTVEGFTFDDETTRNGWRNMMANLTAMGVLELQSRVYEGTLDVTYNSVITRRESILTVIRSQGFDLLPATTAFPTVGSEIVIPPNQVV
jgi:hypothetical protein